VDMMKLSIAQTVSVTSLGFGAGEHARYSEGLESETPSPEGMGWVLGQLGVWGALEGP